MSLAGWANHFGTACPRPSSAWSTTMLGSADPLDQAPVRGQVGLSTKQMRRRFCDAGWRFACNGVVFTGASSVKVTRYRYRGGNIPTPWTPGPPAAPSS